VSSAGAKTEAAQALPAAAAPSNPMVESFRVRARSMDPPPPKPYRQSVPGLPGLPVLASAVIVSAPSGPRSLSPSHPSSSRADNYSWGSATLRPRGAPVCPTSHHFPHAATLQHSALVTTSCRTSGLATAQSVANPATLTGVAESRRGAARVEGPADVVRRLLGQGLYAAMQRRMTEQSLLFRAQVVEMHRCGQTLILVYDFER